MPPCFDVYVWVGSADRSATLSRFVDRYVDRADPGDPRFGAFLRTFVLEAPHRGDSESLAELRRDEDATSAFSLYVRARGVELSPPQSHAEWSEDALVLLRVGNV